MNERLDTRRPIYFILGTRAQFIKVAPLMREMANRDISYQLIYTAQHKENIAEILDIYELPSPDAILFSSGEANTKLKFANWFVKTLYIALFKAKKYLPKPGIVLTHGDTFTAWLAALMGKMAGCKVGHIESGLRSYNIFSPFPEEISRLITFSLSDIYFCPNDWAVNNLKRFKGEKVNIGGNTMMDGVKYALQNQGNIHFDFQNSPYAAVSIHRYENIFTKRFTETIIPTLYDISKEIQLIYVLHPSTRERLKSLNLFNLLNDHKNIALYERFNFLEWIAICNHAAFVITDGGSNQEELSYLGVPTLLFRNETERNEGLESNVVLSRFRKEIILGFLENPDKFRTPPTLNVNSPSATIINNIIKE